VPRDKTNHLIAPTLPLFEDEGESASSYEHHVKPKRKNKHRNKSRSLPVCQAVNTTDGYPGVPPAFAFSRFLKLLITANEKHDFTGNMMADLRCELMKELPDFGQHQGCDGKGIDSHSTGNINKKSGTTTDPDADRGKHEVCGVDSKTGKMWSKVKSWFGYCVHVVADTQYEIPLAVEITPASHNEQPVLRRMIAALYQKTPELATR
jgi:hypothetical protein